MIYIKTGGRKMGKGMRAGIKLQKTPLLKGKKESKGRKEKKNRKKSGIESLNEHHRRSPAYIL